MNERIVISFILAISAFVGFNANAAENPKVRYTCPRGYVERRLDNHDPWCRKEIDANPCPQNYNHIGNGECRPHSGGIAIYRTCPRDFIARGTKCVQHIGATRERIRCTEGRQLGNF